MICQGIQIIDICDEFCLKCITSNYYYYYNLNNIICTGKCRVKLYTEMLYKSIVVIS